MARQDNNILTGILDGFTKSHTINRWFTPDDEKGQQIGIGKCKAVILRMNVYQLNTEDENALPYFYYGDADSQTLECLRGDNSNVIFATRLEQIYIRIPALTTDKVAVQILIYE